MQEELIRQENEKKEIENRLREKLRKQQEANQEESKDPVIKGGTIALNDPQFNDAPTYYQPTIIP